MFKYFAKVEALKDSLCNDITYHHPQLPGSPLKGPIRSCVIQPP